MGFFKDVRFKYDMHLNVYALGCGRGKQFKACGLFLIELVFIEQPVKFCPADL
jgi:hypothetical protein